MADSLTANYGWTKPDVGASDDTWGDKWNANLDAIDAQMKVEADKTGVPEAPDNQTYGRAAGAWNLVVPQAGGTFTGQVNLGAGGTVTSNALLFAGSAVLSVPTIAQFQLGGGSAGQVPSTDGSGNLSWLTAVTGGPYLPLTGGTMTGPLTMQGSNMIALNAPLTGGGQAGILGQKATINRWQMMLGDQTAEGTGNAGSNFTLGAFGATGQILGTWLSIARADGSTTFNGSGVTIAGGLSVNGTLALAGPGNLAIYGGTAGQVLATNGSGVLSWATRLADAPSDGQFYTRQNAAWAVAPGGMTDAPNDGTAYARKSAAWAHLTHTDITDWTATLAPYALTTAVPVASTTTPLMNGVAAIGTGTTWARADHVHPTDTHAMGDNRILNGDMRIDQRNNGASGTANATVYTVDRWIYQGSQASKGTWQRQGPAAAGSAFAAIGFAYSLSFVSSSAYAAIATDTFNFQQRVEADMVSDFAWGTANAQPVTLSFWAQSSLTGAFSGSLRNDVPNRSYPFTFSLPVASAWTKIVITVPGDAAGTWNMSGAAIALNVAFDLGSGANFRTAAGSWAAGSFTGVTGAVSVVGTNGASFNVTGVKLEIGSVATPYNRQSLAKSMADCQRYYAVLPLWFAAYAGGVTNIGQPVTLPVSMRAIPTITFTSPVYTNASGLAVAQPSAMTPSIYYQSAAAGQANASTTGMTASAEL